MFFNRTAVHWAVLGWLCCALSFLPACGEKGCTDIGASNHDPEASRDDGSCEYIGCMDPDAWNYDSNAREPDNCLYRGSLRVFTHRTVGNGRFVAVFLAGDFVGNIQGRCHEEEPQCEDPCSSVLVTDLAPVGQTIRGYYIEQLGVNTYDTLETIPGVAAVVPSNSCVAVTL